MGNNVSSVYGADRVKPNFTQEHGKKDLPSENVDFKDFLEQAVYDGIRRTNPQADNKVGINCV